MISLEYNMLQREKIKSLTEDELAMLWGIINELHPKILTCNLDISIFPSIKYRFLMHRLGHAAAHIKPEFKEIYDNLLMKMK